MAFQTSTIASSTTTKMPAGYTKKYSASATSVLSSTSDGVVTTSISDVFANKKIAVAVETVVRFNADASIRLQASPDGTNWVDVSTISATSGLTAVGTNTFVVDNSDSYAPYWRLIINEEAAVIYGGSYGAGTVKTAYSIS